MMVLQLTPHTDLRGGTLSGLAQFPRLCEIYDVIAYSARVWKFGGSAWQKGNAGMRISNRDHHELRR